MNTQWKPLLAASTLSFLISGCLTDEVGRELDDDERASSCGGAGIVEPTTSVHCPQGDVVEQYVYTKNDAGRTIRLKRFACSDTQQVTPWHSFDDAPGDPVSDSVLGAASLHRDGSMLDYVLSSNGNIYFRERDPLAGSKAEWRVVANTSDFPGDPGTPTQMAMYTDIYGQAFLSVGFSNFSLFRGIPLDNPHITNGGLGGLGLPVTHLDDMSDSDWLEIVDAQRWMKVSNSAVPGDGSQIAHSTYVGYIGGAKALIQGIWKSSGDTWFRWDSGGTGEGFDAATWYCNSLDALAQSWPADVREQVPTATDTTPIDTIVATEEWLAEDGGVVDTPEPPAPTNLDAADYILLDCDTTSPAVRRGSETVFTYPLGMDDGRGRFLMMKGGDDGKGFEEWSFDDEWFYIAKDTTWTYANGTCDMECGVPSGCNHRWAGDPDEFAFTVYFNPDDPSRPAQWLPRHIDVDFDDEYTAAIPARLGIEGRSYDTCSSCTVGSGQYTDPDQTRWLRFKRHSNWKGFADALEVHVSDGPGSGEHYVYGRGLGWIGFFHDGQAEDTWSVAEHTGFISSKTPSFECESFSVRSICDAL